MDANRSARRRFFTAMVLVFACLTGITAANPALGQTLRFAVAGDHRSNMDGTGVNELAFVAIANQISGRGDIQFMLEGGDLQCGEDVAFNPPPTLLLAEQLANFKHAMSLGGLKPAGTSGVGVPVYCIRGNHETWDNLSGNAVTDWINAFGQYLPQNGPTTGLQGNSEVGMTYSFKSGNSLFLGLDEYANSIGSHGFFPSVNLDWVQAQIAARSPAERQGYVFVFGHTPLYQIGEETILATEPLKRDAFLDTLFNVDGPNGRGCPVYFCGHDHLNAFARIMPAGGGRPIYQVMIGAGGGPVETFDGIYSKDFPADAGKAVDLYHDSDPGNHIPFYYSYGAVSVDGDSLWINLYGSTSDAIDRNSWPLLFTLVINGTMTTTAAELGSSGVCNDSIVVFNQRTNGTYYGVMQGLGNVVKTGPGTLEFTGANTYEGGTTIEEGKLLVNNTSGSGTGTGPVLVNPAGVLGGNGAISGIVTNRGTISPGNSIGTLTISGQYIHRPGAVYEAEVNAAGDSDRIQVTRVSGAQGTADIQGGSVRVLPEAGNYVNGTRYTILTAAGGVTGSFDEVIQPSGILHFSLDTSANQIDLVLQRYTYASQAATPYQAAIGGALDQAEAIGTGDMQSALNELEMMSQANLQIAMTELGPMLYDDMTAAALSGARVFSNTLRGRFRELHGVNGIDCRGRNQVWVKDFSNWSSEAGLPNDPPGYRYNATGCAVGLERCLGDNLVGGMSIGYSGTELVEYEGMGHGNVNALHTALYAAWQPREYLHVDTALGWGCDWFKNNRPIYLFNRMADSSHTGQELTTYLGAGLDYPVGKWTIGPQAAIQYVHVDQNNFQEQNAGDLGLWVNAQGADSFQTRIGLETARPFTVYGHHLIPRLRVDWLHEYCGAIRTIPAQFSGAPDVVFLSPGRRYQTDGAIVGGGIDAHLSDSLAAYLNYDVPLLGDSNIISGYSLWLGIGASF